MYPRIASSFLGALAGILLAGAAASTEPVTTILCLGDSLTEGYGLAPEHAYPSVLERRLPCRGSSGSSAPRPTS
jgi:lysophospholipase L1-like esterase